MEKKIVKKLELKKLGIETIWRGSNFFIKSKYGEIIKYDFTKYMSFDFDELLNDLNKKIKIDFINQKEDIIKTKKENIKTILKNKGFYI